MNKERLLRLADFLENEVPPERFRFDSWVGSDWQGKQDLSCGTRACALGWATQIPEFAEAGLHLVRLVDKTIQALGGNDGLGCVWDGQGRSPEEATSYEHTEFGMATAMRFFDLHKAAAESLFLEGPLDSQGYRYRGHTAATIAAHIRNTVAAFKGDT